MSRRISSNAKEWISGCFYPKYVDLYNKQALLYQRKLTITFRTPTMCSAPSKTVLTLKSRGEVFLKCESYNI